MIGPSHFVDLAHEPDFEVGGLRLSPAYRRIVYRDREAILEPKVMQVLVALARMPGEILSRDDLIACCWDGVVVGDDAINRVISQLRKRLAHVSRGQIEIETVTKVGYALNVTSRRPRFVPDVGDRRSSFGWVILVMLMLALGTAGFLGMRGIWADSGGDERIALTLLPFDAAREEDVPLATGMRTALASTLNATGRIEASGLESAALLDERGIEPLEIGRQLGKKYVVDASLTRDGKMVQIAIRQYDSVDGRPVLDRIFRRPETSLVLLFNDISTAIARSMPSEGSERPGRQGGATLPGDDEALFLTAVGLARTGDYTDYQTAETMLRGLERRHPDNAPIKIQLARVVSTLFFLDPDWKPGTFVSPEALELARAAKKLAPDLAEANAIEGIVRGPVMALRPEAERAATLDPYNAEVLVQLGDVRSASLDFEGGWKAFLAAWEIEPLGTKLGNLSNIPATLGDEKTADRIDRFFISNHPDRSARLVAQSRIAARKGDLSEAVRLRIAAMPEEQSDARTFNREIIYRLGLAVGYSPGPYGDRLMQVASHAFVGELPDAETLAQSEVWSRDFFNSWIFSRTVVKLLADNRRSEELVSVYDRNFRSPSDMREKMVERYHASLIKFVSMAPYLATALRDVGRDREAQRLLDLAVADVRAAAARGKFPGWFDVEVARLLAVSGHREEAARHLRSAMRKRWFASFVQHQFPGASNGSSDRALASLKGTPTLQAFDRQLDTWRTRELAEIRPLLDEHYAANPL